MDVLVRVLFISENIVDVGKRKGTATQEQRTAQTGCTTTTTERRAHRTTGMWTLISIYMLMYGHFARTENLILQ